MFPAAARKAKAAGPKGEQEYKGSGNHDWEDIGDNSHVVVRRLRVPGGWLYRVGYTSSTTFVPMPEVVGYKI